MSFLQARPASRLLDETTTSHAVLRREAARCLSAVAAVGDGRPVDLDHVVLLCRRFLDLTSGYCTARKALLWPTLESLFPSAQAEFALLLEHSRILESDLTAVAAAIDEIRAASDCDDSVCHAGLRSTRLAKILHDSLSLNLGDEELVLRSLFRGLSRRELAHARRALNIRSGLRRRPRDMAARRKRRARPNRTFEMSSRSVRAIVLWRTPWPRWRRH